MRENLRTTRYADGTVIVQSNYRYTYPYWTYPAGNASYKQSYGLLYNWFAVMHGASPSDATPSGVQGICPTGWHVPSSAEWTQLTDYVSNQSQYWCEGNSTYIAKALASTTGWVNSTYTCDIGNNSNSNNATGFGVMPTGYGPVTYNYFGSMANFWTTSGQNGTEADCQILSSNYVSVLSSYKPNGYSVRCLRDEVQSQYFPTVNTISVSYITANSAICGGNVTSAGAANVTARGVCWSTDHNPDLNDSHTTDGNGIGNFNSSLTGLASNFTYYVRAYATNSYGTVYGSEVSFTTSFNPNGDGHSCSGTPVVTDIDGNHYNTVLIGGQCWMRENLRTTKYADGTAITQSESNSTTVPCWSYPAGDSIYKQTYGLLYNWKAIMRNESSSNAIPSGVQGICPTGWHVPSDTEWTQLTDYVSSQSIYRCGNNNTKIAKALAATIGWENSTFDCSIGSDISSNNATWFGALPSGRRGGGSYWDFGSSADFWSSTETSGSQVYSRFLHASTGDVPCCTWSDKYYQNSVRCLRD